MKRTSKTASRTALFVTAMLGLTLLGSGGIAHAGGFCHEEMRDATGTFVHMKNNCMTPTVLRVGPGTNVTFSSADLEPHTVTGAGYRDDRGWGSMDELQRGDTVAYTFEESGVFPYFCIVHPGMIGAIVVGDGVPVDAAVARDAVFATGSGRPAASSETASLRADAGNSTMPDALVLTGVGVVMLFVGFGAGALVWRLRAS